MQGVIMNCKYRKSIILLTEIFIVLTALFITSNIAYSTTETNSRIKNPYKVTETTNYNPIKSEIMLVENYQIDPYIKGSQNNQTAKLLQT